MNKVSRGILDLLQTCVVVPLCFLKWLWKKLLQKGGE